MDDHSADGPKSRCDGVRYSLSSPVFAPGVLHEMYRLPRPNEDASSVPNHLRSCSECREWFEAKVGAEAVERAKRSAKYCCMAMFLACEEATRFNEKHPALYKEPVTFSLWRGEDPRWYIGKNQCTIAFCPWCGERLPDAPFRTR
jgi:hypothetical protein